MTYATRKKACQEKAAGIEKELSRWAAENEIIGPGEQLKVTIALVNNVSARSLLHCGFIKRPRLKRRRSKRTITENDWQAIFSSLNFNGKYGTECRAVLEEIRKRDNAPIPRAELTEIVQRSGGEGRFMNYELSMLFARAKLPYLVGDASITAGHRRKRNSPDQDTAAFKLFEMIPI